MNVIITTPTPFLYKTFFPGSEKKDAPYYIKIATEVIEEIGPERFIGGVTDSEATMVKVRREITRKYPWIIMYGCIDHYLNNLMKDIGSLSYVSEII